MGGPFCLVSVSRALPLGAGAVDGLGVDRGVAGILTVDDSIGGRDVAVAAQRAGGLTLPYPDPTLSMTLPCPSNPEFVGGPIHLFSGFLLIASVQSEIASSLRPNACRDTARL